MCELGVDLSVRRVVCWIMSGEVMNLLSNGNYGLQMTHFRLGELLDWKPIGNLLDIHFHITHTPYSETRAVENTPNPKQILTNPPFTTNR